MPSLRAMGVEAVSDRHSLDEQVAAVKREISLREQLYPRWASMRKMSQIKATTEIDVMRDVLHTLEQLQRPDPICQAFNEGDGVYRP